MPIYSYKCRECEHEWDWLGKWDDDPELCEHCRGPHIDRQLSAPNFTLKKGPYGEFL